MCNLLRKINCIEACTKPLRGLNYFPLYSILRHLAGAKLLLTMNRIGIHNSDRINSTEVLIFDFKHLEVEQNKARNQKSGLLLSI